MVFTIQVSQMQAQAIVDDLDRKIKLLEEAKVSGVRAVDDVDQEVRQLRKKQKDIQRAHLTKKRFGIF
ncbi:unnamed protein product [Discosporangium mesarthrocarpum]